MATDTEYALMAGAAYRSSRRSLNSIPAPNGWTEQLGDSGLDTDTGFEAGYFVRGTEIVISFAGTDPANAGLFSKDMQTNLALANGKFAEQLFQAAEYYLKIKAANTDASITLTGHSLGGGLASLIGVFFDVPTTAFDPAPFSQTAGPIFAAADMLLARLSSRFTAGHLTPLNQYIQERSQANPIPRQTRVNIVKVDGELLDKRFLSSPVFFGLIGNSPTVLTHGGGTTGGNLHSQALLTAFLQSADTGVALNEVSKQLPSLLARLFDNSLYAYEIGLNNNTDVNFLEHLVRHQTGGIGDVPEGGDGMGAILEFQDLRVRQMPVMV